MTPMKVKNNQIHQMKNLVFGDETGLWDEPGLWDDDDDFIINDSELISQSIIIIII